MTKITLLTVTVKGQAPLKRDLLKHLGIEPDERIDLEKLPGGDLRIRAAQATNTIDGFLGLLAGKTRKVATIEEMNEGAAAGWAVKASSLSTRRRSSFCLNKDKRRSC